MISDKISLPNGLRLVLTDMPQRKSVSIGVWFKVGGRYETKKEKGIAHFLEHMVFKGSKKFSSDKIKRTIEGLGGSLNGFTSEEFTCYLAKVPYKHALLTLEILSDMSLNPKLDPKEIEKERSVILEEIKMYKDHPAVYVNELLDKLMWPDNPLGDPIIGDEKTLLGMKREELKRFNKDFYNPANTIVSISGALDSNAIADKVKSIFSDLEIAKKSVFFPAKNVLGKDNVNLFYKTTEQTHLAMGFYGLPRNHSDRYILSLINVILGANMSSRLFDKVREKRGLAYEIGTSAKYLQDTGMFLIHAGIKNDNIIKCVSVVLEELNKIKREPVMVNELKRAKEFFAGQLELGLEDTLEHMLWVGESVASLDKVDSLSAILESIYKISPGDLQRVSSYIFKPNALKIAVIGPHPDKIKGQLIKETSF